MIRTNNACEGYNNRLREKIKFIHPSPAYLINVLINEEDEFRKFTLSVILKKKGYSKKSCPCHMDSSVKMPINELFDWLTDFITKNLILSEVNIDDFNQ